MKKIFVLFLLITGLVFLVSLASCSDPNEEENVKLATSEIPLIDTLVPAKVETATFSLG